MTSINGLPPSIGSLNQAKKTNKKNEVKKPQTAAPVTKPSKVANAVAHSIRSISDADYSNAQLQYDLPQGRSRKAMEEYMDIMNHAKREELSMTLGVDIYI
ncbi:chromosome partitioning protein ParA [Vibrio caribbeanicus]|uniref:chromosome partitioning protein ParA n=1 Tax=Vibrio caribbeanicus TaxID=701175 RepID=UPI0030D8455B